MTEIDERNARLICGDLYYTLSFPDRDILINRIAVALAQTRHEERERCAKVANDKATAIASGDGYTVAAQIAGCILSGD